MKAYKAHRHNFKCRHFQYEVGGTYSIDGNPQICVSGFHACENPIDVIRYYPNIINDRYSEVELSGKIIIDDNKLCASSIKINRELSLEELIDNSVKYMLSCSSADSATNQNYINVASRANTSTVVSSGYHSNAANSGDNSVVATKGDGSNAANSGNFSSIVTTGWCSNAASSGDRSNIVTTGGSSPAVNCGNESRSATTGNYSHSVTVGNHSSSESKGKNSIACSLGEGSVVKSTLGNLLVLIEYDSDDKPIKAISAIVDNVTIMENIRYRCVNGSFVEV